MNLLITFIQNALQDDVIAMVTEAILVMFYIVSCVNRYQLAGKITRGQESSTTLRSGLTFLITIILGQLLGFSDLHYRSILYLLDIWVVFDLFMINQWSQNKFMGIIARAKKHTNTM